MSLAEHDAIETPAPLGGVRSRKAAPGLPPSASRDVRAIAEALFSDEKGAPDRERLDYVEHELADFFGNVTLRARLLYRLCVFVLTWLGPITIGRFGALGSLSIEDRIRAIERIEHSPLSLALLAVKAMLCIVYYEHPGAAADIGWDQECAKP